MLELDGQQLTLGEVARVARGEERVSLASSARERMSASRRVVERIVAESRVVYGVNTGFGKLSDVIVGPDELRELQLNLVRSHSCGVGSSLSEEETRAMILLRANVLAKGFSGALAVERSLRLVRTADVSGAMSLEALKGTPAAFDERIHRARPHRGQVESAAHLRELLRESEIRASHIEGDPRVQDAYSLRCMPQVHGATRDALAHARACVEVETGGATDNPLVFAETGEVVSGGNFHGAPLALAFDYACIALVSLGNIVERRVDRLVNPDENEGLPAL